MHADQATPANRRLPKVLLAIVSENYNRILHYFSELVEYTFTNATLCPNIAMLRRKVVRLVESDTANQPLEYANSCRAFSDTAHCWAWESMMMRDHIPSSRPSRNPFLPSSSVKTLSAMHIIFNWHELDLR